MRRLAVVLLAGLAACSTTVPYRHTGENNLEVRAELSKARASLHIHRLDEQCRAQYEGSVTLDQPVLELALPPERSSLLVVSFSTSSFLGGSRGTTSREYALKPRAGYRYRLEVRYKDDLYDVVAFESSPRDARGRPLPLSAPNPCPPSR